MIIGFFILFLSTSIKLRKRNLIGTEHKVKRIDRLYSDREVDGI